MALKELKPAPVESLDNGWQLIASEAGRTHQGLRATVTLFNGVAHAYQTLALGDLNAQQALVSAFASLARLPDDPVRQALITLAMAVEGTLRQMETQAAEEDLSQAAILVALATQHCSVLFHTPEGEVFAVLHVGKPQQQTWGLKSQGFRRWLGRLYYAEMNSVPSGQAIHDALTVLEGQALYDGPEHRVFTRLAEHRGAIYLDLANDAWQAIEISGTGWRVIDNPPVKFRRARGMLELPLPTRGGSLNDLRAFVNIASDNDWRLFVSYLLMALHPQGPFPVLILYGEQGSAKSTQVRVLRHLVDPNTAALRTTPRDERDLVIAATNGWLIALDNLSHLPDWLSDSLCRLANGSGFATRQLWTDNEEAIFQAQRPIVLNGITEVATRPDLLDRAIILYLPTIAEAQRQEEAAFWQRFTKEQPAILGALLTIMSEGLKALPTVQLTRLPRMADFAKWGCAVAQACGWTPEEFLAAYQEQREAAHELTLEASSVAPVLRTLLDNTSGHWEGTASELLAALEREAQDAVPGADPLKAWGGIAKQKGWPKNGRSLSNMLRRLAPTLRAVGVTVEFAREGDAGRRIIRLLKLPTQHATSESSHRVRGEV